MNICQKEQEETKTMSEYCEARPQVPQAHLETLQGSFRAMVQPRLNSFLPYTLFPSSRIDLYS